MEISFTALLDVFTKVRQAIYRGFIKDDSRIIYQEKLPYFGFKNYLRYFIYKLLFFFILFIRIQSMEYFGNINWNSIIGGYYILKKNYYN
jgi:hypothetical protein